MSQIDWGTFKNDRGASDEAESAKADPRPDAVSTDVGSRDLGRIQEQYGYGLPS